MEVTRFTLTRPLWARWPDVAIPVVGKPQMIPARHSLRVDISVERKAGVCELRVVPIMLTYSSNVELHEHCSVEQPYAPEYSRQVRRYMKLLDFQANVLGHKIAKRHLQYIKQLPIADINLLQGYYGRRRKAMHTRLWKFARPVQCDRRGILKFIEAVRNSLHNAVQLYTQGNCYGFARLLQHQYPHAVIWYDRVEGHIYTRIGGTWYDIRGAHYQRLGKRPLDPREGHPPHRWRPS